MGGHLASCSSTLTKEGHRVKANIVVRMVAVIGIIALSVTMAQAGGNGGAGGANQFALDCRIVGNAVNQNQLVVVDGTDTFRLGSAMLLCKTVTLSKGDGTAFLPYSPTGGGLLGTVDDKLCYGAVARGAKEPPENVTVKDGFGTEIFRLSGTTMICAQAEVEGP
jgi:hypothetical protein